MLALALLLLWCSFFSQNAKCYSSLQPDREQCGMEEKPVFWWWNGQRKKSRQAKPAFLLLAHPSRIYFRHVCMLSYHLSHSLVRKGWKTKVWNNIITDIMYIFPFPLYVFMHSCERGIWVAKKVALLDWRNILRIFFHHTTNHAISSREKLIWLLYNNGCCKIFPFSFSLNSAKWTVSWVVGEIAHTVGKTRNEQTVSLHVFLGQTRTHRNVDTYVYVPFISLPFFFHKYNIELNLFVLGTWTSNE